MASSPSSHTVDATDPSTRSIPSLQGVASVTCGIDQVWATAIPQRDGDTKEAGGSSWVDEVENVLSSTNADDFRRGTNSQEKEAYVNRMRSNLWNESFADLADSDLSQTSGLNTVNTLRRGIVHTSPTKNRKVFTILLVGETGVGKTSILSLFYNIMRGNGPDEYNLPAYEPNNETGGSQATGVGKTSILSRFYNIMRGSGPDECKLVHHEASNETYGSQVYIQTQNAMIYEIKSRNGFKLRILDTPGLGDTRGLSQDQHHKQSIAEAIRRNVDTVDAVLILANGTNPRLDVATDYTLTTLTSIFPQTLIKNIGIMFTNVSSPLSWNFESESLPDGLHDAEQFLIDNPISLRKKLDQLRSRPDIDQHLLHTLHQSIEDGHAKALNIIAKILNWVDTLQPLTTNDILHKLSDIDRNIVDALTRTQDAMTEKRGMLFIATDLESDSADLDACYIFIKFITNKIHVQEDIEARFCSATSREAQKEILATQVEDHLKKLDAGIKDTMATLTDLSQSYSELALRLDSNFVGQVEKSVRLLGANLESLQNDSAPDRYAIDAVEQSLEVMRGKLELLK